MIGPFSLKEMCDITLANHFHRNNLELDDFEHWLGNAKDHNAIILTKLLEFVKRVTDNKKKSIKRPLKRIKLSQTITKEQFKRIQKTFDDMTIYDKAWTLVSRCTNDEVKTFSLIKSPFGECCQLELMYFGKQEWETYLGCIGVVPPPPDKYLRMMEMPDFFNPSKKIKDTHTLFYRPKKVNDKNFTLNVLVKCAQTIFKDFSTDFITIWNPNKIAIGDIPVDEGRWILITNYVIPGTRGESFLIQEDIISPFGYEVPKVIDVVLANIVSYIKKKQFLFDESFIVYTRCKEKFYGCHLRVGRSSFQGLSVSHSRSKDDYIGMAGVCELL